MKSSPLTMPQIAIAVNDSNNDINNDNDDDYDINDINGSNDCKDNDIDDHVVCSGDNNGNTGHDLFITFFQLVYSSPTDL